MKALVIAELDEKGQLHGVTTSVMAAAFKLHKDIAVEVLMAGHECEAAVAQAKEALLPLGVTQILHADSEHYTHGIAEHLAKLIESIYTSYQYILAPATTFGKNLIPRAAGLVKAGILTDIIDIIDETTFIRPIYAGCIYQTVSCENAHKFLTIRPTAFNMIISEGVAASSALPVKLLPAVYSLHQTVCVNEERSTKERPELATARIVVAGGRGVGSVENFRLIDALAERLGAAVGATRAAVDAGFAPNDYQIGQTGKVIAPDLYIAVGISGAIQHLAGIMESRVIVAINRDSDAPIFELADYKLVGDLHEILPKFESAIKAIVA